MNHSSDAAAQTATSGLSPAVGTTPQDAVLSVRYSAVRRVVPQ